VDDIRTCPCPQCTYGLRIDARDQRPGPLWFCPQCSSVLVIDATLQLVHATPGDIAARPIPEQEVLRAYQMARRGMRRDIYC